MIIATSATARVIAPRDVQESLPRARWLAATRPVPLTWQIFKRSFDVVSSAALLVLLAPVFALIAIGIYLPCLQDSWSHSGYGAEPLGHVKDGTDPDNPAKNAEMGYAK